MSARRTTATGTGTNPQTGIRFTALNRDGITAYALAHGMSVNQAVNQAVSEMLTRDATRAVAAIGTTRGKA